MKRENKCDESSVREEENDGRNRERQINTCPQTCKHMVRKGIKLIKSVGWLNCAKRDTPERRRGSKQRQ